MQDAWREGLLGQARLLAEGRVSAVDLADLAFARIERLNPRINAVVALNPAARDDAAASDARRREGRGARGRERGRIFHSPSGRCCR